MASPKDGPWTERSTTCGTGFPGWGSTRAGIFGSLGDTDPIDVDVEDPDDPATALLRLSLARGALATSSTRKRAWGDYHHVIDPATGAPARTELVQATVWAPTCADAEVASTHALLLGSSAATRYPSVLVTTAGDVVISMSADAGVAA